MDSTPTVIPAPIASSSYVTIAVSGAAVVIGLGLLLANATLVAIIMIVGGVAVSAAIIPSLVQAARWQTPEFVLDRFPVELGAEFSATYRVRPKKPRALPPAPVSLTLECVERATYTVGSSTRTAEQTVYSTVAQTTGAPVGDSFEATTRMAIPLEAGAPSLNLRHNKIVWSLKATIDGKSYFGSPRSIAVPVLPVIAADVPTTRGHR